VEDAVKRRLPVGAVRSTKDIRDYCMKMVRPGCPCVVRSRCALRARVGVCAGRGGGSLRVWGSARPSLWRWWVGARVVVTACWPAVHTVSPPPHSHTLTHSHTLNPPRCLPSLPSTQGFSSNAVSHALRILSSRQELQYINEQRQLRRVK
jgi:hypothetical protein